MFDRPSAIRVVLLQRPFDRPEERSPINRFSKKIDGSCLHCAHCHWNVAPASDEDDRYRASLALKFRLQFKTRHAWHANVGDKARGLVSGSGIQKLLCGAEAEREQSLRFDQILECALN